jgi:hypothetical protein
MHDWRQGSMILPCYDSVCPPDRLVAALLFCDLCFLSRLRDWRRWRRVWPVEVGRGN